MDLGSVQWWYVMSLAEHCIQLSLECCSLHLNVFFQILLFYFFFTLQVSIHWLALLQETNWLPYREENRVCLVLSQSLGRLLCLFFSQQTIALLGQTSDHYLSITSQPMAGQLRLSSAVSRAFCKSITYTKVSSSLRHEESISTQNTTVQSYPIISKDCECLKVIIKKNIHSL